MVNITLPDGQVIQLAKGSTVQNVAEHIGPGLAKAALAGRVQGKLVDLSYALHEDTPVQLVTLKDEDGVELMRHSCAHVKRFAVSGLTPSWYTVPLFRMAFITTLTWMSPFVLRILNASKPKWQKLSRQTPHLYVKK